MRINKRGQTILEYTLIVVVMLGVMITMQTYVKRGIQGRWRSAADDFGGQYDPAHVNADINYSTQVNAISIVTVAPGNTTTSSGVVQYGNWTNRVDQSNSLETKVGFSQVGF